MIIINLLLFFHNMGNSPLQIHDPLVTMLSLYADTNIMGKVIYRLMP